MTSTAYLLVFHGSRDPRYQGAINRLAQLVRERLNPASLGPWSAQPVSSRLAERRRASGLVRVGESASYKVRNDGVFGAVMTANHKPVTVTKAPARSRLERLMVGTAVLDFGLLPLHQQICEFGRRLSSAGVERLMIVPLFLLQGKHVMDDIPEQVEQARCELNGLVELEMSEHIGGAQAMPKLIANRFFHAPKLGRLMVAHGSRRPKGNRSVDDLAKSLGMPVAYWTQESDIENQAIYLMQQGCSQLTIFPYFLFAGGITDAVTHLTEELAERFPRTRVRLLPPLGATSDIANLIVGTLGHRLDSNARL